jgi:hypothetical protein
MQSANNFCAIVLAADDRCAPVGISHSRKGLGHVPRNRAHRAEFPFQAVKTALPLEELAFLLAENPIERIHSASSSPASWSDLALFISSGFRQS